ncbi:MAG: HAMP domain-containing protein, partial [Candidatus Pacebacteria bacterium]|nr:HAMP domain-containing protein [Candidatus Paceibacterota bacterium]
MNLLTKLTIILFSFAIFLMVIFGYSFFEMTRLVLHESSSQNQLEFAQTTMLRIDEKMYGRYLDIQDFANCFPLEDFVFDDVIPKKAQDKIDGFLENSENWDALGVVDRKTGSFIVSTDRGEIGKKVYGGLENKKVYQEALAGNVFVSDVLLVGENGLPTVIFSAPIKSKKDEQSIVGVIIGRLSWSVVDRIIKDDEDMLRRIHLFAKDETMISTNGDREYLFKKPKESFIVEVLYPGKQAISVVTESEEGTFKALVSRAPQLGYLEYKGNDWNLIVETPLSLSFIPAYENTRKVLIFVIPVVFSTVLFLLLVLNRFITSPIKRLTKTAQKIANGNMVQRAQVRSKDEIGHLSQSFNLMTDSLVRVSGYVENIIKTMPMSLIVMDDQGKIKTVNEATLRMLGYKKKDLLGKDIKTVFVTPTANTRELLKKLGLEKLTKGKHLENVRTHLKSKDGEQIRVDLSVGFLSEKEKAEENKSDTQIPPLIFITKDLRELTYYAYKRLNKITPILQKVAMGDFSQSVEVPKEEDEFTEHMIAIQIMIDDFREMFQELQNNSEDLKIHNKKLEEVSEELKKSKEGLEKKVSERT